MDQVVYSNKGELQGEEDGDVDAHCSTYIIIYFIGASLSKPHTYRTAVQNPPDIYILLTK